jgi:hypothetical protein
LRHRDAALNNEAGDNGQSSETQDPIETRDGKLPQTRHLDQGCGA